MTKNKQNNWEERFDKRFENLVLAERDMQDRLRPSIPSDPRKLIKQFIKSLLSQQRQEIINQIKEMRLKAPSPPNRHRRGFNQAIDQIIKSLKEK